MAPEKTKGQKVDSLKGCVQPRTRFDTVSMWYNIWPFTLVHPRAAATDGLFIICLSNLSVTERTAKSEGSHSRWAAK